MNSLTCLHSQKSKYWQIYGAIHVWLQASKQTTNKNEQQVKTEKKSFKALDSFFYENLFQNIFEIADTTFFQ